MGNKIEKYLKDKMSSGEIETIMNICKPFLISSEHTKKIKAAFSKIYSHIFGYRDLHMDRQSKISDVIIICIPLVKSYEDLIELLENTPRLVKELPCTKSEATMIGWVHEFSLDELKEKVANCKSIEQLLSNNSSDN